MLRPLCLRALRSLPPTLVAAALLLITFAATAGPALGQGFGGPPKASMSLAADRTSYVPGEGAAVAARVTVDEGWHMNSHTPTFPWLIPTDLEVTLPDGWPAAEVAYPPHELKSFAFQDEPLAVYDGTVVLRVDLSVPEGTTAAAVPVQATLHFQACNDRQCLPPTSVTDTVTLTVGGQGEPVNEELFRNAPSGSGEAAAATGAPADQTGEPGEADETGETATAPATPGGPAAGQSLLAMLALGVLGGLILNAMPCVLPVLSLKVFGLVKSAGQGRSAVVSGALATAAGILLSFWALAGAAVAARAAGAAIGWGVQFQNPVFVIFLLVVVLLFCLNLWGLFEIPLPQLIARAAGTGPREGVAGHLVSGLFATLMATPCSAPFLGTAIAFGLSQPAGVIFAIFTAVGTGMALPYLALAAAPRLAGALPKPGAWMDTLRKIMGFLLAAAAVWLLYVLASQVSREARAWIELSLLGIAFLVWLRQRALSGAVLQRLADLAVVAVAVGAIAIGWQAQAARGAGTDRLEGPAQGLIDWVRFDRDQAESLARDGRLVFVDVTADWCFTCKVNERLVLETEPVAEAFARHQVVPMKADWTNRNDTIAAFLEDHGRFGIPFYMLYRPGGEPHVFSELISQDKLVELVEQSAAGASASGG